MLQFHPIDAGAIKTTGRKLVQEFHRKRPLNQLAVMDAINKMRRHGWFANYTPGPFQFDRTIVLVPSHHRFEPLFRCLNANEQALVPRGLIESRTNHRITNSMTGTRLGVYGLAIVSVQGCNVVIRGTSSGMAFTVNSARYGETPPRLSEHLVENATGLVLPPERLNDDLRLRTAMAFEEFLVDVPGFLDGEAESHVRSRWHFTSTADMSVQPDPDVPF